MERSMGEGDLQVHGRLNENCVFGKLHAGIGTTQQRCTFTRVPTPLPMSLTLALPMFREQENGGWTLCWGADDPCHTVLCYRPEHLMLGECPAGRCSAVISSSGGHIMPGGWSSRLHLTIFPNSWIRFFQERGSRVWFCFVLFLCSEDLPLFYTWSVSSSLS